MAPAEVSGIDTLEKDEFLQQLIHSNSSDAAAQMLSVAEQLSKLSQGIALLDKEIQKQVLENHEDLLSQATWIEKLEVVLDMMTLHIQSLVSGVERVKLKIGEPLQKMEQQNILMTNILQTLDLLRRVNKVQVVSKRLSTQNASIPVDMLALSHTARELTLLWSEQDLSNIELLEADRKVLSEVRKELGERARQQLEAGLDNRKEGALAIPVQVLWNLGTLEVTVKSMMQAIGDDLEVEIHKRLDTMKLIQSLDLDGSRKSPGGAAIPMLGNITNFNQHLWTSLEKMFNVLHSSSSQVILLESALKQRRSDVVSHSESYLDSLLSRDLTTSFWSSAMELLASKLSKAAKDNKFVKEALEGEYPRLLRLCMDLSNGLQGAEGSDNVSPFLINKKVVDPFEKAYLGKSSEVRKFQIMNICREVKTQNVSLEELVSTISSELRVALFDTSLLSSIAKSIASSVKLFCNQCENEVDMSPEALQVIGPRTDVQERNIRLANTVEDLKLGVRGVISNLRTDPEATAIISLSLATADSLIKKIMSPMLGAVRAAVEKILLTMHKEDFSRAASKGEPLPSLYMKELQSFMARAHPEYLKPFASEDVLSSCGLETGRRCLDFFLRQVSLVRHIGPGGRAKLMVDCAQLELILRPLLGEEPRAYRTLRAFRMMLTQSPEEISNSPALGDSIPYSLALFHLFSHAPEEMKTLGNKTAEELSDWLAVHESERERLSFISGALGRYCNDVRQVEGKSFHPVYAIMAQLIEKNNTKSGPA